MTPVICGCSRGSGRRLGERRLPRTITAAMQKVVMSQTNLTPYEITSLYMRYRQLAPTGEMSFSKFRNTMGMFGMLDDLFLPYRMFCAFDENEDNNLDFVEFATALGIMIRGSDDAKLELAFKILTPMRSARRQEKLQQDYETFENGEFKIREATGCSMLGGRILSTQPAATIPAVEINKASESLEGSTVDGLTLFEFQSVVASLELTRRQLIGRNGDHVDDWFVERVFRNVSSSKSDGTPYMTLGDFKKAVRSSADFLYVLGIYPGAQDRHLNAATRASMKKSENRIQGTNSVNPSVLDSGQTYVFSSLFTQPDQSLTPIDQCISQRRQCNLLSTPFNSAPTQSSPLPSISSESVTSGLSPTTPIVLPIVQESTSSIGSRSIYPTRLSQLTHIRTELIKLLKDFHSIRNHHTSLSPIESRIDWFITDETESSQDDTIMFVPQLHPVGIHSAQRGSLKASLNEPIQITSKSSSSNQASSSNHRQDRIIFLETPMKNEDSILIDTKFINDMKNNSNSTISFLTDVTESQKIIKRVNDIKSEEQDIQTSVGQGTTTYESKFDSAVIPTGAQTLPPLSYEESSDAVHQDIDEKERLNTITRHTNEMRQLLSNEELISHGSYSDRDRTLSHIPKDQSSDKYLNLETAESRLKRILEWIDRAIAESNEKPNFDDQLGDTKNQKLINSIVNTQTGFQPGTQAMIGRRVTTPCVVGASGTTSDHAFLYGSSTGEIQPRMFMNKPNFEERRARRQGSIAQFQQRMQRRRAEYKLLGPQKGFAVHFGHPSWNMVLNMMVGIRIAAGRINNEPRRRLEPYDFIMKEKISILPKSANLIETNLSNPNIEAVRFIDYAPMLFRKIREFFGVSSHDYLQSVGPEQLVGNMVLGNLASLSELCSEGKSGAFFYYTADGRFLIKTITRDTAKFLQQILRDYYEHIVKNPDTLITRFYGFHAIRLKKKSGNVGAKLYFIIMGNFFHTPVEIHRRYDLKGSWIGRSSGPSAKMDPTIALKDLDLIEMKDKICIGPERKDSLVSVIQKDAEFFQKHSVLDYSLLVGIHFKQSTEGVTSDSYSHEKVKASMTGVPNHLLVRDEFSIGRKPFHQREMGGMISSDGRALYYLGIIDILTWWTTSKKIEHDFKAVKTGYSSGISCVHPSVYAKRFAEFLQEHIE